MSAGIWMLIDEINVKEWFCAKSPSLERSPSFELFQLDMYGCIWFAVFQKYLRIQCRLNSTNIVTRAFPNLAGWGKSFVRLSVTGSNPDADTLILSTSTIPRNVCCTSKSKAWQTDGRTMWSLCCALLRWRHKIPAIPPPPFEKTVHYYVFYSIFTSTRSVSMQYQ